MTKEIFFSWHGVLHMKCEEYSYEAQSHENKNN